MPEYNDRVILDVAVVNACMRATDTNSWGDRWRWRKLACAEARVVSKVADRLEVSTVITYWQQGAGIESRPATIGVLTDQVIQVIDNETVRE